MLTTPEEDWAIAHELAHQWWGNLVTCADWTHFWLNEGITTFMVAAWKEHRWGRPAYDRELAILQRRADEATAAGLDVPLTYSGALSLTQASPRDHLLEGRPLHGSTATRAWRRGVLACVAALHAIATPGESSRAVTFSVPSSRQAGATCRRSSRSGSTDRRSSFESLIERRPRSAWTSEDSACCAESAGPVRVIRALRSSAPPRLRTRR